MFQVVPVDLLTATGSIRAPVFTLLSSKIFIYAAGNERAGTA